MNACRNVSGCQKADSGRHKNLPERNRRSRPLASLRPHLLLSVRFRPRRSDIPALNPSGIPVFSRSEHPALSLPGFPTLSWSGIPAFSPSGIPTLRQPDIPALKQGIWRIQIRTGHLHRPEYRRCLLHAFFQITGCFFTGCFSAGSRFRTPGQLVCFSSFF